MVKPTWTTLEEAQLSVKRLKKAKYASRCDREIAREWLKLVKEDCRDGFQLFCRYQPFRTNKSIAEIYAEFAASIRTKYEKPKLIYREHLPHRRERL